MSESSARAYCGPEGLRFRNIVGLTAATNVITLLKQHNCRYVHKGRTANSLACKTLGLGPAHYILAPSYNCGSEIDALLGNGVNVSLYRIDRAASIDIRDLKSKITHQTKAIYVIHYFGFSQQLAHIKSICIEKKIYLIEDCALSLFSFYNNKMLGTTGDVAIFSLPKTMPVPDGGIFLVNNPYFHVNQFLLSQPNKLSIIRNTLPLLKATFIRCLLPYLPSSTISKFNGFQKQSFRIEKEEAYLNEMTDMPPSYYYNSEYDKQCASFITLRLIRTMNIDRIKEIRRRNFLTLNKIFEGCEGIEPLFKELPAEVCPLNFPLLVERRDSLVKQLNHEHIDARAWWRGYHQKPSWSEFPDACYLKNNLMTLPIHQDITESALKRMAARVMEFSCNPG